MPIHLKRKNGEVTPYKNSEMIPAFYFIPKEFLDKCPKELQDLPRHPWEMFHNWDAIRVVESDLFLELMMDAYAYMVWPYLDMGKDMEVYSGYDPVWVIAHSFGPWAQTMTDLGICPTVVELARNITPWERFGYLSLEELNRIMWKIVPATVHRYNLKEVFAAVKENRCFEDFDDTYSTQKVDLIRKWYTGGYHVAGTTACCITSTTTVTGFRTGAAAKGDKRVKIRSQIKVLREFAVRKHFPQIFQHFRVKLVGQI